MICSVIIYYSPKHLCWLWQGSFYEVKTAKIGLILKFFQLTKLKLLTSKIINFNPLNYAKTIE